MGQVEIALVSFLNSVSPSSYHLVEGSYLHFGNYFHKNFNRKLTSTHFEKKILAKSDLMKTL
jgi:hypothetical protein